MTERVAGSCTNPTVHFGSSYGFNSFIGEAADASSSTSIAHIRDSLTELHRGGSRPRSVGKRASTSLGLPWPRIDCAGAQTACAQQVWVEALWQPVARPVPNAGWPKSR